MSKQTSVFVGGKQPQSYFVGGPSPKAQQNQDESVFAGNTGSPSSQQQQSAPVRGPESVFAGAQGQKPGAGSVFVGGNQTTPVPGNILL